MHQRFGKSTDAADAAVSVFPFAIRQPNAEL